MSASKEKKKRQNGDVLDKKQKDLQAASAKKKRNTIITVVVVVAAVLLIAFAIFMNSDIMYTTGTALKVGNYEFTAGEVNYFYYSAYLNEYKSYGDYASYILDTDKSLSSQEYSEGVTWDDHFRETAINNIRDMVMLCEEAEKAGFTLSDTAEAEIETNIQNYQFMATYYGYKSADAYYTANFGRGVNEKVIRKCMKLAYLSDEFRTYKKESFEYSNSEIDSYYEENKDTYDTITYRMYYVSGAEKDDTTMEEAKEKADYLTSSTTELEFAQRVYEVCKDSQKDTYKDLSTTRRTYQGKNISSNYNEWLLDSSRKSGDTTAVESVSEDSSSSGYYVVYFIDRDTNSYPTANIRYAYIEAKADDDGNVTDDAMETARLSAKNAYDSWEDGDATEDSFITMVMNYSSDSSSASNGGLDEYVNKVDAGTFGEEMVDWVLSDSRKAGDTATFETDSGCYIVYYSSKNEELYYRTLARTDMQDAAYEDWKTAQLENYPAENGTMLFKVGE